MSTPVGSHGRESKATVRSLGNRIVALGAMSRDVLGRALGVHHAGGQVRAAAWMDSAVEVDVLFEGTSVVFRIERAQPTSKGLVVSEQLVIFSRGQELHARLATAVRAACARTFEKWTFDQVAELVARDPERGRPGLPMPPSGDEGNRPQSLLDTWGADDSYADFFAGGEIARSQLDSIDPSKLFQFVQHCDAECLYVNPHTMGTIVPLVNYPWDERVREPLRPTAQGLGNISDATVVEDGMVTTDLDETDVIRGNPSKLAKVVDYALSRPNVGNKLIFVSNTCVPTVVGEDVESTVKQARTRTGLPVLYLTVTPRSMTNVFEGLLVDRRLRAEATAEAAKPSTINLIGFAGQKASGEIDRALAAAGIGVNVRLLPDLDTSLIDRLPEGSLHVVLENKLWQHLYDQVLEPSRTPHLISEAPYGWSATQRWLRRIVERLGLTTDMEKVWSELTEEHAQRWDELRKQASEHRLGVVVRDQEAYYLTTPASTWGVPLIAMMEEMGFGIDVLVRVSQPRVAKEAALAIRALFNDPSRHSIRAFDSFAFLRQRLADSPASAYLTYHFFDWRLSEAGKSGFSLQHFEMGVAGAVRTLERLLGVCKTPFYRRYARYLRRTAEGLRAEHDEARDG